jgi:hypothetical protein
VDTIIGERVKAEDGPEGIVVAVDHGGGGTSGWQPLMVMDDLRLAAASALNARLVRADPLEPYRGSATSAPPQKSRWV